MARFHAEIDEAGDVSQQVTYLKTTRFEGLNC